MTNLVNQGKVYTHGVRNGSRSLGSTGIWADNDRFLVVGDVLMNVALEEWSPVQIIHGNIKETLVLRVM